MPYDYLLYAVGAESATFGVPGVREHCYFLKEVADAMRLRRAPVRHTCAIWREHVHCFDLK
jgi:NADH dehydrogenase FAD-containing subunit